MTNALRQVNKQKSCCVRAEQTAVIPWKFVFCCFWECPTLGKTEQLDQGGAGPPHEPSHRLPGTGLFDGVCGLIVDAPV